MTQYNYQYGYYSEFKLSVMEILLMCATLCSTDVVAAVSIVSYEKQP